MDYVHNLINWSDELSTLKMNANPLHSENGIIFKIKKYALHDGPGIRTTVFLKGCPMVCWWCHNPEGQQRSPQNMPIEGTNHCREEIIGCQASVEQVLAEIEKDVIFYDDSGGGVTFSGGEPLMQAAFLKTLLVKCRQRDIHTAVDTTGYAPTPIMIDTLQPADLILFDLKIMDANDHQRYTGVTNTLIFENLEHLIAMDKRIRIRFPLIPGITDRDANIHRLAKYIRRFDGLREIDLLPYHHSADAKYNRLNIPNRLKELQPPSKALVQKVKERFEHYELRVNVGG